jgi:hypothetical protein
MVHSPYAKLTSVAGTAGTCLRQLHVSEHLMPFHLPGRSVLYSDHWHETALGEDGLISSVMSP